jgi:predicted DNA-binding transcriptional regulator AlpA
VRGVKGDAVVTAPKLKPTRRGAWAITGARCTSNDSPGRSGCTSQAPEPHAPRFLRPFGNNQAGRSDRLRRRVVMPTNTKPSQSRAKPRPHLTRSSTKARLLSGVAALSDHARKDNARKTVAPASDDPLAMISKREVAALLSINAYTLDRWRRSRPDFPNPIWLSGTTLRWARRDIELFIATRQRGGRSPDWQQGRTANKRGAGDAR